MAYVNMNEQQPYADVYPPQQTPEVGWKPHDGSAVPMSSPSSVGQCGTTPIIDPEDLQPKNMSFSDESIRKGFIRKVYLILMAQLMFTFGVVSLFVFHEPTQEFTRQRPYLLMGAFIITFSTVIAMTCCENARRLYPMNFICLSIFTVAESFLIGFISSRYQTSVVFMALGIAAVLCLALTIFAMQTKYDFTMCGGFLLLALICVIIIGLVGVFWRTELMNMIYACLGALVMCLHLIYDTQIMIGGTHKYSISPEEYIYAALNLYLDITRIFLFLLRILGGRK